MLKQDFENAREFLLKKLPDYLKMQGINIDSSFKCINPKDTSHLPSMSYNPNTYQVECFNCGAKYNIFDVIGIYENLPTLLRQFIKAHELFRGEVPLAFIDILKSEQSPDTFANPKPIPNENIVLPNFEIENDFGSKLEPLPFGQDQNFYHNKSDLTPITPEHKVSDENFNDSSPFDEVSIRRYDLQDSVTNVPSGNNLSFNKSINDSFKNLSSFPKFGQKLNLQERQANQSQFADTQITQDNFSLPVNDFSNYINACANNVNKTTYFKDRGISESVIKRFKLGYDESFAAEIDNVSGQTIIWQAAIIPYGDKGYCVRNADLSCASKKERYKKKGSFDIYNVQVLSVPGTVYITEGEFDALSLETLGYRALGLGGVGNVRLLVERIKNSNIEHDFYICLDNDDAGIEASNQLSTYLDQLGIKYQRVNLAYPYKDINEALYTDRDTLEQRIANLDKILAYQFSEINPKAKDFAFINQADDFDNMQLSKALYATSGSPIVLRALFAQIIRNKTCSLIYAAPRSQCNNLSHAILKNCLEFNRNEWDLVKFLNIGNEQIIEQVFEAINSLVITGNDNFAAIIDLTSYANEFCLKVVQQLANQADKFAVPIVVMCNKALSENMDGLCIQNLLINYNDNGDFICSTYDKNAVPISFIKTKHP